MKLEDPIKEQLANAKDEDVVRLTKELDATRKLKPINYRDRGKLLLLSVMYGLGADSLAYSLGIELDEAKTLLEQLHEELRGVREYETKLKEHVRQTGHLVMIGGRKRRFPNYALPEIVIKPKGNAPLAQSTVSYITSQLKDVWKYYERKEIIEDLEGRLSVEIVDNSMIRNEDSTRILNSAIQGSAAGMTKLALLNLRRDERLIKLNPNLKGKGLVFQIHDEAGIQVPKEHAELGAQILKEAMEKAAKTFVKRIPFVIEPEILDKWEA